MMWECDAFGYKQWLMPKKNAMDEKMWHLIE